MSSNYYRTPGVASRFASTKHANAYSTLTYQARMRRTGCTGCSNYLIIRGVPTPLEATYKTWYRGIRFQYTSNGYYSIWKDYGSTYSAIKSWTATSSIVQNGWNTLKVTANGSAMKFYINNVLVWSGSVSANASGQVGIGMYRDSTSTGNQLLVNWAGLSTTAATINGSEQYPQVIEQYGLGDGGMYIP
ncbi:MAG: hypothetical protein PHQ36_07335 [Anaerolineales bacterium]|nr:hypothetical protein [Anaerolineales bacterium]